MMVRGVRALKNRGIRWLAQQLAHQAAAERPAPLALLGQQTRLSAEGQVDNLQGDPARIQVGDHSFIRGRLLVYAHGGSIRIGAWSYLGVRSEIWSMNAIHIGERVLISHDVNIHDGAAHSLNAAERHAHYRAILTRGHPTAAAEVPGLHSAPIVIEDDVWISFGVTILKGVRIGAGSVIAAGALVTHDVPPQTLYRCEVQPVMTPLKD